MAVTHHTHKHGFTLIEVLVSVVILGIGIVGVAQLYIAGMWSYQKAHYLALATQRAQQELEYVQREARTSYWQMTGTSAQVANIYPSGQGYSLAAGSAITFSMASLLPSGSGKITITTNPFGLPSSRTDAVKLASATIEINWQGPQRTQAKVKVFTLVACSQ